MRSIFLVLFLLLGCQAYGQDLYWLLTEEYDKKKGEYFPEHGIHHTDKAVFHHKKLIFRLPIPEIYNHYFEIFEDENKHQSLIITQVFDDQDDFASISSIIRQVLYIIPLDGSNRVYVTKLHNGIWSYSNGLMLSDQSSYDFYGSGNKIHKIDLEAKQLVLLRKDRYDTKPYHQSFKMIRLERNTAID